MRRRGSGTGRAVGVAAMVLLVGVLGSPAVPAAGAAVITPNVFTDDTTTTGNCTLREAILSANFDTEYDACPAGNGADEIRLGSGSYQLSVGYIGDDDGFNDDLDVREDLTIVGNGPALTSIDGMGIDRVFHLHTDDENSPVTLNITGLTVTGGDSSDPGGGIMTAEYSRSMLTDVRFVDNESPYGGGIENLGVMTLQRVTVTDGRASGGGGGISTEGELTMLDSAIFGNRVTSFDGGGIEARGTTRIVNSTIANNEAERHGGGLYNPAADSTTIESSTIVGNRSNTSTGGVHIASFPLTITSSIVSGNTGPIGGNCGSSFDLDITSGGYNVADGGDCNFTQPTDQPNADPQLGPLASNGGPMMTMAIAPSSPAVDRGWPGCPPNDQRGAPRNNCDSGAYEVVVCGKAVVNLLGTAGDDVIQGTSGPDGILGFDGKDKLSGLAGPDGLCGGTGKDTLRGGGGKDRLVGEGGKDRCLGGPGKDKGRGCERKGKIP